MGGKMGCARVLMLALITIVGMYGCGAEPLDEMGVKYYISNVRVLDGTTDNDFSIDPTALDDKANIVITLASRKDTYDLFIEEVILVISDRFGFLYPPPLVYPGGDWLFSGSTLPLPFNDIFDKDTYSGDPPEKFYVDITVRGSFSKGNGVDITFTKRTEFYVRVPAGDDDTTPDPL